MVSRSKLYGQLEQLEDELRDKLINQLNNAAKGTNHQVFCVQQFNTHKHWKNKTDYETELLVDLGAKILTLRKKLGEPSDNTIAEKICWYCQQWNENIQSEPKIAQILAQQFLDAINTGIYK